MARDYAQGNRGGRRPPARRGGGGSGGMPGWIWLVLGLAIGLSVAAYVYIKRPAQPLLGDEAAAALGELVPAVKPPRKPKEAVKLPPKEKPRFTFYELLPSEEVVVPRIEDKNAPKPAAGDGSSYVIQVASYRDKQEAERQKASLALLGVESRIESVTIDGADTFYRVRVGPLKDFGKVQIISNRLADNGIEALVVKVKK
ncbi:MAG TPA: SPOR domain-containing protein [Solimonas sp.]|nr:SPOR domain-containing protein [Solimonas sp.]